VIVIVIVRVLAIMLALVFGCPAIAATTDHERERESGSHFKTA